MATLKSQDQNKKAINLQEAITEFIFYLTLCTLGLWLKILIMKRKPLGLLMISKMNLLKSIKEI